MTEAASSATSTPAKPDLSVSFHNFYAGFAPSDATLVRGLSTRFRVTVEAVGRDLQFSGAFGTAPLPQPRSGRPLRVWWTGEARDPKGTIFDLYFGFAPDSVLGKRWCRFPLWIDYVDWWDPQAANAVERLTGTRDFKPKPRFCTFIASNNPAIRTEFFLRLDEARSVESLGRYLNNRNRRLKGLAELRDAIATARFNIAFENQIAAGYVTEKIVHPLLVGAVPIYWGAAEAQTDFNPAAFIDARAFATLDDLVRHVLWLDDTPSALAELVCARPFVNNQVCYERTPYYAVDRIEQLWPPVAAPGCLTAGSPKRQKPAAVTRWRDACPNSSTQ